MHVLARGGAGSNGAPARRRGRGRRPAGRGRRPRTARAHPSPRPVGSRSCSWSVPGRRADGGRFRFGRRRAGRTVRRRGHRVVRRRRHGHRGARARRAALRARARHRWTRADRRDRDRARSAARNRGGVEASARRPPGHEPATTSSSRGRAARSNGRCRCCSTRSAARSTTTATSRTRRRCCASSRPAAPPSCPGLTDRLSALVGVPVEDARPRELVASGDIGFSEEELPRLDPYLPAAVGLALGGAGVGTVINLLPRTQPLVDDVAQGPDLAEGVRGRCGAGGRARRSDVRDAAEPLEREGEARRGRGADRPGDERAEPRSSRCCEREAQIQALQSSAQQVLSTDVAWQKMVERITANLPAGVTLTSFTGQVTPPAPVVAAPVPAPTTSDSGSSSSSGSSDSSSSSSDAAADRPPRLPRPCSPARSPSRGRRRTIRPLAAWIDAMAKVPQISDVYVTNAQTGRGRRASTTKGLTFTATAVVAPDAVSDRVARVHQGGVMKTKNLMVGILVGVLVLALVVHDAAEADAREGLEGQGRERRRSRTSSRRSRRSSRRPAADAAHAAEIKAELDALQRRCPTIAALADFIRDANAIASASGVAWQSVTHASADTRCRRRRSRSRSGSR